MADSAVEKTETVAPVEKEVEKPVSTEETEEEEVVDAKKVENKPENGLKKDAEEDKEKKVTNGTESTESHDACPVKRKSTGGNEAAAEEAKEAEGASPEKKAKLDSNNGEEKEVEAKVAA